MPKTFGYCHEIDLVLTQSNFVRRSLYSSIDPETQRTTDQKRRLGLVVVRGTQVSLVCPQDGVEEIANPFVSQDED